MGMGGGKCLCKRKKKTEVKRKISVFQVFLLTTQLTKHLFLNLLLCEIGGKM